ncbi:MAG: hypothetical protein A3D35_01540 [Candidatus Staskawiczbacteria bacterium RIFCSPHIGHO2_02_FULL_34_9]|uniref:Uncharacterized protein n=1 Tax=Candidatus Staskawiczbacteria bacterium RIFCSPHIGHO2_02_FULL_34_9 TaxID=1802206 RepID=A0A1G2HX28_9BACT|nr:MAG: hypothetical protein A3D35_01540 [Candidatus Staskawiczbacteria bacterium RIFCSPHIGHO2_02_FULL_34_9]
MKLLIILIITVVWISFLYGDIKELKSEIDSSNYLYDNCSNRLIDYQDALQEANYNIENAQSYAWSSYYDMGYALDDLQTVDEP